MSKQLMTKKDLIAALDALGDDDLVLIKCDGGQYWGHYLEVPWVMVVTVTHGVIDGQLIGHPGGTESHPRPPEGAKVAVLCEF